MDIEKEIMGYRKKAPAGCLVTSKWGTEKQRKKAYIKKKGEYTKLKIFSKFMLGGDFHNAKKKESR